MVKGRFAPSPSGRMHAGNIYASLVAYILAHRGGGGIVLRIEDIDPQRCREEYAQQILRDYESLGLYWDEGPHYQSLRLDDYRDAYQALTRHEILYPCFCSRADLHAASAPHRGEKPVYPGTCRGLTADEISQRTEALSREGRAPSWRIAVPDVTVSLTDEFQGPYSQHLPTECGDFLLKRSDGAFAYQLAVVVDDAAMGVTQVTRGVDLLCSTPQQIFLQEALGLPTPDYAHVPLLVSREDRRLSKRDKDASFDELIERYLTPQGIIGHIAFACGMIEEDAPCTPDELVKYASLDGLRNRIQIAWKP